MSQLDNIQIRIVANNNPLVREGVIFGLKWARRRKAKEIDEIIALIRKTAEQIAKEKNG